MNKRTESALSPIEKLVTVPWSQEEAFRRFTGEIHTWWPTRTHSVGKDKVKRVAVEARVGGRVYEEWKDGEISVWGTVTAVESPQRIAFTWHPGRGEDTAQLVEITFQESGDATTVRLVHSNWEAFGDGAVEARADYTEGWDGVLQLYTGEKK